MTRALILWSGPVYGPGASPYPNGDIGKVDWLGVQTDILTVSFNGSAGAGIYAALRDASGRALPNLLAQKGFPQLGAYDHVSACGYSAGHNFLNPLLLSDGDSIDSCVSIDACFSAQNPPWTKQGYVDFGTKAALGQKLMVLAATGSSHGNAQYPSSSGSECAVANFDASSSNAGVSPLTIDSGLAYPPTTSERAGSLYLLDYAAQQFKDLPNPGQIPHWHIVNNLSRDIFQTYLAPWNAGAQLPGGVDGDTVVTPGDGGGSSDSSTPIVLGLAALTLLTIYFASRNR